MPNTKKDVSYRDELLRRSTIILEKTKKNYINYKNERISLFNFTNDESPNYIMWEHMINIFESLINLEEKYTIKSKDLEYLESLSLYLKEQKIREDFPPAKNHIFKVTIKNQESIYFITRFYAEIYIKNKIKFLKEDYKIEVIENKNQELNSLLDLIIRNF